MKINLFADVSYASQQPTPVAEASVTVYARPSSSDELDQSAGKRQRVTRAEKTASRVDGLQRPGKPSVDRQNKLSAVGLSMAERPQAVRDAIGRNDVDALRRLLAMGVDLESRCPKNNDTPLLQATFLRHVDCLRLLLNHEPKPSLEAKWPGSGATALVWATESNNPEAVRLLLQAGASAHAPGPGGWTLDTMSRMDLDDSSYDDVIEVYRRHQESVAKLTQ